jgi:hypothetical protein
MMATGSTGLLWRLLRGVDAAAVVAGVHDQRVVADRQVEFEGVRADRPTDGYLTPSTVGAPNLARLASRDQRDHAPRPPTSGIISSALCWPRGYGSSQPDADLEELLARRPRLRATRG